MKEKDYMIEGLVKDLAVFLIQDFKMSMEEALRTLYNSDTFAKMEDENTGLYYQSSRYVYDFLKSELRKGKMFTTP